jgi:signal transduction histidine kinase
MQIELDRSERISTPQSARNCFIKTNVNGMKEIISDHFPDNIKSARIYVLEKSSYSIIFENMEYDHPFESCDFIEEKLFEELINDLEYESNILKVPFLDFDLILELKFEQTVFADKFANDIIGIFANDFDRCLQNTVKENYGKLSTINRLSQAIMGCLDLETIFSSLVMELKTLISFDRISICTFHSHFDSFRVEAIYETADDNFSFMKQYIRAEKSNIGMLLETKKTFIFNLNDSDKGPVGSQLLRKGIKSVLLSPIMDRGELIASLQIGSIKENGFDENDIKLIDMICKLMSRSIIASGNYSKMRELMNDYQDAQEMFLHTERYRNFIDITRGVLHSFNNHLALIMGRTQLLGMLSGDVIERAKLDKGLDVILKATSAASEQISSLQKYARTREQEEPDQIQIKGLVEEIVALSMPRWKAIGRGKIEFEYNVSSQIHVVGNRKKVRDALINLLMNAVEAEKDTGGKVLIEAEENDDFTTIIIKDNGIGMSAEQITKAYEPFISTKDNGTGLGLSVSFRIVREHRGNIEIQSAQGKGTTVRIVFPKSFHANSVIDDDQSSNSISKVVIIDKQKIHLNLLSKLLEGLGLEIRCCTDVAESELILKDFNPDLVIWDDSAIDCDPEEFVKRLHKSNRNILTCLVGASFDHIDQQCFEGKGINALLSKPYEKSGIISMLHNIRKYINNKQDTYNT